MSSVDDAALALIMSVLVLGACPGPEPVPESGSESTGTSGGSTAPPAGSSGAADSTSTSGLGSGTAEGSGGGSGEVPTMAMHVVSLNLLHGFPDFLDLDSRTALVVDWIIENEPDVIALQEVGQTPLLPNRAQVLAEMTGYEWAWAKASGLPAVFEEGPGVLSRWPITWVDDVMLPHPGMAGFEVRRTIGVGIDTPLGEVAVFSAHLTTQDDETVKADQALVAYEFIEANTGALGGLFAGDMNAEPDTLAMRMLRGEQGHDGVLGDLVDAWLHAYPKLDGFTSPSDAPERRIDYVYVVPGASGPGTVQSCALVLGQPVDGLYASDHIGVDCEVVLTGAP